MNLNDSDILFALMGDSHITPDKWGYREVKKAFEIYTRLGVDAFVLTGDIIYQVDNWERPTTTLSEKPYDYYNELKRKYTNNKPIIYCMGNHEYAQNTNPEPELLTDAVKLFEKETSQKARLHTVINGFHFIAANISDFCCTVTADTEEWCEKEIDKALAEDDTKPVFVIIHEPVQETVIGSKSNGNAAYSKQFKDFLNERSRVVFLCGHVHTAVQNPRSIWQDGFTAVHSPNTSVGALSDDGIANEEPVWQISQGLLVSVKDNYIKIYKLDFNADKFIGEPWEIDINSGRKGFLYTDKRFKNTNKPYFGDDARLETERDDTGRTYVKFTRAQCEAYGKNQDGFAAAYNIKVTDAESGKTVSDMWYQSDYYRAEPTCEPLKKHIDGLISGHKYIFEIYAANPFGAISEKPLRKEITG